MAGGIRMETPQNASTHSWGPKGIPFFWQFFRKVLWSGMQKRWQGESDGGERDTLQGDASKKSPLFSLYHRENQRKQVFPRSLPASALGLWHTCALRIVRGTFTRLCNFSEPTGKELEKRNRKKEKKYNGI
jgi:hypothetical protein